MFNLFDKIEQWLTSHPFQALSQTQKDKRLAQNLRGHFNHLKETNSPYFSLHINERHPTEGQLPVFWLLKECLPMSARCMVEFGSSIINEQQSWFEYAIAHDMIAQANHIIEYYQENKQFNVLKAHCNRKVNAQGERIIDLLADLLGKSSLIDQEHLKLYHMAHKLDEQFPINFETHDAIVHRMDRLLKTKASWSQPYYQTRLALKSKKQKLSSGKFQGRDRLRINLSTLFDQTKPLELVDEELNQLKQARKDAVEKFSLQDKETFELLKNIHKQLKARYKVDFKGKHCCQVSKDLEEAGKSLRFNYR